MGYGDRFKKGDAWIVPMPSRTYTEQQKVYAYYQEYFELDLSTAKRGVQLLKVTVEDQVSGQTATGEIRFRYGE
jgi:hypothetical protein